MKTINLFLIKIGLIIAMTPLLYGQDSERYIESPDGYIDLPPGYVIVNFWAEWCETCVDMIESLDSLDKMTIVIHVDIDDPGAYEYALSQGLESLPFVLFFYDGELIDYIQGDMRYELEEEDAIYQKNEQYQLQYQDSE